MFEPTQTEVDQDVHKSIDLFERAMQPGSLTIAPPEPESLLLALDASAQDEMSVAIVQRLKARFDLKVTVIDARDRVENPDYAAGIASKLQGSTLTSVEGEAYEKIQQGLEATGCDLLVVPSPFGRDIDKVGEDSTGTVMDVLLARSNVPVLVTRKTYPIADVPFAHVFLAMSAENEAAPQAGNWAVTMLAPSGNLQLMLVVEDEAVENMQAMLKAMHQEADFNAEKYGEALRRSFVPLHTALMNASRERKFKYSCDVYHERHAPLQELTSDKRHPLLVLGFERADHLSQGYVHDRIRRAENTVLVIPR
ncbi:MAG: hypothetical protein KDA80_16830 [Planctomycetaceae bacterium]|nr:hypothetical protein [Planctomycetaceae bacterium]